MNQMKIVIVIGLVLLLITGTLFYNKSRMAARSKNDILKSIPVSVTTVNTMKLSDTQSLTGTIAANNDVSIVAETEGRVTAVYANIGDYKPAGSVLIQLEDELKKAAYAAAEVNYEKSKNDLERLNALHEQHVVTDQQYENARFAFKNAEAQFIIARKQYNDTKITTPISGIVTSRLVDVGAMVQSKAIVANVVDISKLKVKLSVAEQDVFRLHIGDQVEITTSVYPGTAFTGTIETISSKSDEAHTYPIEIGLKNSKEHPLKAGMFARVAFTTHTQGEVVAIPRAALVGSFKKPQVYVINNGIASLRDVVVSNEIGTDLVIQSGLSANEMIVINGQNNLKDKAPVTIVK